MLLVFYLIINYCSCENVGDSGEIYGESEKYEDLFITVIISRNKKQNRVLKKIRKRYPFLQKKKKKKKKKNRGCRDFIKKVFFDKFNKFSKHVGFKKNTYFSSTVGKCNSMKWYWLVRCLFSTHYTG